jgi:hypothetical protein
MAEERGRPTKYTRAIADEICKQLSEGATLNQICTPAEMPSRPTVLEWVRTDRDGFSDRYTLARDLLLDHWADEVIDISDDTSGDTVEDAYGKERQDSEWVNRSRLRVDTRKWLLSKLKPERYGDRMTMDQNVNIAKTMQDKPQTDDEWERQHSPKAKELNGKATNGSGNGTAH